MTHKKSYIIRAIGVVCSFSLLSSGFAQKVDEIVARHFEAIGGAERLKGIMSTRTVSIVSRFDGVGDVRTLMYAQRPHKIRVEYAFPQALVVMAYNGEIGWSQAILPNGKKLEPAVLSPEKTLTLLDDFDDVFDDSLFNFGAKGHRVDLVGRAQIMGHEAYELELTLKEGGKEHRFIDVGSYLEIERTKFERKTNSAYEIFFSDFKTWNGLTEPSKIKVLRDGKPVVTTTIVSFESGYPVESALFEMPKVP